MGTKNEAVVDNLSKVVQVITLPQPIILEKKPSPFKSFDKATSAAASTFVLALAPIILKTEIFGASKSGCFHTLPVCSQG